MQCKSRVIYASLGGFVYMDKSAWFVLIKVIIGGEAPFPPDWSICGRRCSPSRLFWGPSHLNQHLWLCLTPWCWRRLLRVPWTARRSNQSILKSWIFIGRTDAEAEALLLWPPDEKNWLIGKDSDPGKDWRWEEKGTDRRWDGWMASPTQWTWIWVNSGSWWWTGRPGMLQLMRSQRVGHDWATELNWGIKGQVWCSASTCFSIMDQVLFILPHLQLLCRE